MFTPWQFEMNENLQPRIHMNLGIYNLGDKERPRRGRSNYVLQKFNIFSNFLSHIVIICTSLKKTEIGPKKN